MKMILFQGDSITDTGKNSEGGSLISIGQGYAAMIAGDIGLVQPGKYCFVNKGISGNRIVDLYARVKTDVWNLKPDLVSLLIGVNDVLHETQCQNGVDAERFEKVYTMLIEDTIKKLPDTRFILMEPFIFRGSLTETDWDTISKQVRIRGEIVKNIADKFNFTFVPLQKYFDEACQICPIEYWVGDGVHPTVAGHAIIKREWLKGFSNLDI